MKEGSWNDQHRNSIWDLHWGAASSASSGASPSAGEEDEEWGGGQTSAGSMEGDRRGLGGTGPTLDPAGGASGRWEARQSFTFFF